QVQDKLFRVHRFLFQRESEFFEALFSLNSPAEQLKQGTGDDNPLVLPGVTINEFEALLDYFYYRKARSPQEYWILLLSIATRYDFDEIREHAIREISSLVPPVDPIRLVRLAFNHDVSQWLEKAYTSLCTRPHPLTPSEATKIGPAVARRIGRCRAELIMAYHDTPIARTPTENEELARKFVRKVFWPYGPST
ncbi:hypothetical protein BDM02DRAFT_3103164, partial [Thelephora ganbajun]